LSETGTNRKTAQEFLASADETVGNVQADVYTEASALIGIGYALLDVADAIRDQTARQVPLEDVEALLMRVATAPEHADGRAAMEPE
jgi:hypothetical protein